MTKSTLFDPRQPGVPRFAGNASMPYSVALSFANERNYAPLELDIFRHVLEHEVHLYEPRGHIFGPLTMILNGKRRVSCMSKRGTGRRIPPWVERDGLEMESTASAVLLIDGQPSYEAILGCKEARDSNVIFVTGCGLPRYAIRRLLHRLSSEFALPVYVLTDNDTWGYFLFSLIVRGSLSPGQVCPQLGVRNAKFLGLHAGDPLLESHGAGGRRAWKSNWSIRLEHLKTYEYFRRSAKWKNEFAEFERQKCAYDLFPIIESCGASRFVEDYLKGRM